MYYTIDKDTGMFVANTMEKFAVLPLNVSKGLIKLQNDYDKHVNTWGVSSFVWVVIKRNLTKLCASNGVRITIDGVVNDKIQFLYQDQELILPDPVTREVLFEKKPKVKVKYYG